MQTQPARITKAQAIAAFDGNASALARALNITPQAVYQWQDGPISESHDLKLRFVVFPGYAWTNVRKKAA